MLKSHATELLNYIPHRITNAASEGLNSIIQLIKANARGLPNFKNFRIRSECSNPTPQNCSTTSLTASPMLPAKASTPLFNSSRPTRADYPTSKTSASDLNAQIPRHRTAQLHPSPHHQCCQRRPQLHYSTHQGQRARITQLQKLPHPI